MALHGNRSVLHKSPVRFINGRESLLRNNFNKHGMQRNAYEAYDPTAATPYGHLSPSAWVLPKTAGGMSSQNVTVLTTGATGLAYGGVTTTATTSISFTVANAAGELISSGNGSAAMSFTFANALLTASLGGTGSATLTFSTNTPLLGAEASAIGNGAFTITGTMTPYAIGNMAGSTVDTSTIVNANIVSVNGYSVTGNGQTGTEWGPVI